MKAKITILGSGTSMGVPTLGCECPVCTSTDPRDKRTRPSIAIRWEAASGDGHCVVIDTGPDFRRQALRENLRHIDAVFYTHAHADHILGLDDLRPLSFKNNGKIPLYADDPTAQVIERVFDYTFAPDSQYTMRARVAMHRLTEQTEVDQAVFCRVPIMHGDLPIAGFRFGSAAYLTDLSTIPEKSLGLLDNLQVVILDALRRRSHPTHETLAKALELVDIIKPRQAFFTHMSHDLGHAETEKELPSHVRLAYDGLEIPFDL